jgi:hypothetical protein
MRKKFNLPQYKAVNYDFNPQTGYYAKSEKQALKTPVMRLPFEMKIAPTQVEKIKCNAKELFHSREKTKTGSYKFITGLQKTNFNEWFLGNDFEMIRGEKVISIILFHFAEEYSRLTVYYFSHYDKGKTEFRLQFANEAIPYLLEPEKE